jgi:hypothetical protein
MDPNARRHVIAQVAFWVAAALAAAGGIASVTPWLSGTNRLASMILPLMVGAAALAVIALERRLGRTLASLLYLVAGLAIVYALLSGLSLPVRLAVLGTCPPAPAPCPQGFSHPMTATESGILGFAIFFGVVAILAGAFGLVHMYRSARVPKPTHPEAPRPDA